MVMMAWQGRFFEVLVTRSSSPLGYRVHVLPQPSAFDPALTVVGIHCPCEDARRELRRFLNIADCLAAHLEAGGNIEHWEDSHFEGRVTQN